MTTDRDDPAVRRYREASATLDEQPSATARAAILAAAARNVEARPQAADAPRISHRRRWPLAAAAAVLLSSLAVMMAQRTAEEMPTFTAPAESQDRAAAPATSASTPPLAIGERQVPSSPSPATADAPQASGKNAVGEESRTGTLAPGIRMKKAAPADPAGEPAIAASPRPEARDRPEIAAEAARRYPGAPVEQETSSGEARRALPAVPPQPAAAMPAPAEAGTGPSATDAGRAEAPPAVRAARKELAPAPVPQARGSVTEDALRNAEKSASDWLARIVTLRGEGRHAEADAELKRFRERFPEMQVPPAAWPPAAPFTGTR